MLVLILLLQATLGLLALAQGDPITWSTPHWTALNPTNNAGTVYNKCLDVRGAHFANGTPVQIYDCNGTPAQNWTFALQINGPIRVTGTNFCLDAGSNQYNGQGMKIWQCYEGLSQQTWWVDNKGFIKLANSDVCLDLTDGNLANGKVTQQWQCFDNNNNQRWYPNICRNRVCYLS